MRRRKVYSANDLSHLFINSIGWYIISEWKPITAIGNLCSVFFIPHSFYFSAYVSTLLLLNKKLVLLPYFLPGHLLFPVF